MTLTNAKYDHGKAPLGQFLADYPATFQLLSCVTAYGAMKYGVSNGFLYIPGDFDTVQDKIHNSVIRHLGHAFAQDTETGLPSIVQALSQLTNYREREFARLQGETYCNQVEQLYGPSAYRQANESAKLNANQVTWSEKWRDCRSDMLAFPQHIPLAETLLRCPATFDAIALARHDYQINDAHYTLIEKFNSVASALMTHNRAESLFPGQTSDAYDVAASFLFDIIEQNYPDPKRFLL